MARSDRQTQDRSQFRLGERNLVRLMTERRAAEAREQTSDAVIIPITLTVPADILSVSLPSTGRAGIPPFRGWSRKSVPVIQRLEPYQNGPSAPRIVKVQLGPEDPATRPGVEQLSEDLQAEAEGRPVPIRPSQLRFTPDEVQGLRALFGQRPEAAQALVEQLRSNAKVSLPAGVTKEVLERYARVAESAISRGIDKLETQKWRLEAIRLILKELE